MTLLRAANVLGVQGWFCLQLLRMGEGKEPDVKQGALSALIEYERSELAAARRMRRGRKSGQ